MLTTHIIVRIEPSPDGYHRWVCSCTDNGKWTTLRHAVSAGKRHAKSQSELPSGDAPLGPQDPEFYGMVEVDLWVGREPETGIAFLVKPLPKGSHDRHDCPCIDHPPGEVGPCAGCDCAGAPR